MKTLVLMRHAKAESRGIDGSDAGRVLSPRGRQEASAAGLQLAELGLQHALVSSATRTRQTFECLALDMGAEYQHALYNCGTETMLQRIRETDEAITGLLVVGHAPAIPSLAAAFTWAADRRAADQLQCHFPTAAFEVFTFDAPWSSLDLDDLPDMQRGGASA